jgi:hypothetical protein
VHFLDSWAALPPLDLARLAVPVALLFLSVFVPGRVVARLTALGVAASLPFVRELGAPPGVVGGWVSLWLAIAWQAGLPAGRTQRAGARLGGLESGSIGLLLGPALLALLVAAAAGLDLDGELTRRSSYAMLLICLGFLHLMLRRHAVRAATAFAAAGLGLQVLGGAVRTVVVPGEAPAPAVPLLAAALAAALAVRIGRARASTLGSAWVGDAHDLHD